MAKFYIDFKQTVSTARVIEADTEKQAVEIAEKMIRNDNYWEGILENMENDPMNWLAKECEVYSIGNANPNYEADNE